MIKPLLLGSILAVSVHSALHAQETNNTSAAENSEAGSQWIGVFGHYYRADEQKFPNERLFEEGDGYGFEYGYKFTKDWAARVELAKIEMDQGLGTSGNLAGESIGIDAMYFINESSAYVFAGARYQDFYDSRRLGTVGIGKHWSVNDDWKIVTEVAGLHDFGESHRDMLVKLGVAYSFGTSKASKQMADQDNDGVADAMDRCANTPLGASVDEMGCEIVLDSDNDGIANSLDKCPSTPAGTRVDATGCAIILDSDNDGILNDVDECTNTPKGDKVDAVGCSVLVEKEVSQSLRINFASESAEVRDIDADNIEEFAAFLTRFPNTDVLIEGHASARGDADYNMQLSTKRADAAKALLVNEYGIEATRIRTKGYGETQLLDKADTEQAHRKNRRITARVSTSIKVKA